MFTSKHYWKIILILILIVIIDAAFLYSTSDDLFLSLFNPLASCGMGILLAVTFEKFGFTPNGAFPPRRPFDEQGGLIPFRRFLVGIFWSLAIIPSKLLTQPDSLVEPWLWSMVISAYSGWIIGIATIRYRRFKKKSETPIENKLP